MSELAKAAELLAGSRSAVGFTGAGISVESGIPSFRGPGGLWQQYDPSCLDIRYFHSQPEQAWTAIREIFYDFFGKAQPNAAHEALAELERRGKLAAIITQNIDSLHQHAGSKVVVEYHGASRQLMCIQCYSRWPSLDLDLHSGLFPPSCSACGGLLKPDFVFFGEPIPEAAATQATKLAANCDLMIVVGTSGAVMPACSLPYLAKENGAAIIEVNPEASQYTAEITDVHLAGPAGVLLADLVAALP